MPVCPDTLDYAITATPVVTAQSVTVAYPTGITQGDLLLLSTVRGDFDFVTDETFTPSGWTLIDHKWGANRFMQDVFGKVATGTETGSVTVSFGGGEDLLTTGTMICLRGTNGASTVAAQLHASMAGAISTVDPITAPSVTPTSEPALLFYFAGVPNGELATNYTGGSLCLLGGAVGSAYTRSNQIYAEVLETPGASGTRSWAGFGGGWQSDWRGYVGGLVTWRRRAPTVGFIGFNGADLTPGG